ncbi:hypothetical protein JHK85_013106 [Glycine max]|nr:hypothetical protein JHK85_013106 [Glycine max]
MLNERAVPFLDPSVDLSMTGLREWKIRKEMDLFISNWLLFKAEASTRRLPW